MKRVITLAALLLATALDLSAQAPAPAPGQPAPMPPPPQAQRRVPVQVLGLQTSAWTDGGSIPVRFTQAGDEVSPPLSWTGAPDGTVSFVLIAHDVDAATGNGLDDVLHWLVWNIPGRSTGLAEGMPAVAMLPDGSRQISVTGPGYRGPGAAAAGPAHHYVFEIYALDSMIDVPAVGQSPAATRAAVFAAMAGHVRGKGAMVGIFKRP